MRKVALLLLLSICPAQAGSSGFFAGGMADGMRSSQELDLERQAIDIDRRYGTSHYDRLRQERQNRDLQREIQENNRLLREMLINRR